MGKKSDGKDPRSYAEFKWTIYTWYVLHTIALFSVTKETSPVLAEQGAKYVRFFSILWKELPCPDCTEHYVRFLKAHPLNSKTDLHEWMVGLHNDVNRRIGTRTYTSKQARDFYMLNGKLVVDWWYFYFMVKTFANVAYTNNTISQFCKTLDALRKVVPSTSLRKELPKSKKFADKRIFIRRYLITLKKRMDSVDPKVKELRFTTGAKK